MLITAIAGNVLRHTAGVMPCVIWRGMIAVREDRRTKRQRYERQRQPDHHVPDYAARRLHSLVSILNSQVSGLMCVVMVAAGSVSTRQRAQAAVELGKVAAAALRLDGRMADRIAVRQHRLDRL